MRLSTQPEPPGTVSDALDRCIEAVSHGDRDALAELYGLTHAAVYGFALSITKNAQDAEDVLQDVYLHVWQSAGQYRSQNKPMAWLITMTRNLALSRLRERERSFSMEPQTVQEWLDQTPAATPEDRLALDALLSELSDEERQIVTLHALTGLKHREIARLLDLPMSTVRSKYNRALNKLKRLLKEDGRHA